MSQLIGCFLAWAINSYSLAVIIDHPVFIYAVPRVRSGRMKCTLVIKVYERIVLQLGYWIYTQCTFTDLFECSWRAQIILYLFLFFSDFGLQGYLELWYRLSCGFWSFQTPIKHGGICTLRRASNPRLS